MYIENKLFWEIKLSYGILYGITIAWYQRHNLSTYLATNIRTLYQFIHFFWQQLIENVSTIYLSKHINLHNEWDFIFEKWFCI
jgi:hypothetical protein